MRYDINTEQCANRGWVSWLRAWIIMLNLERRKHSFITINVSNLHSQFHLLKVSAENILLHRINQNMLKLQLINFQVIQHYYSKVLKCSYLEQNHKNLKITTHDMVWEKIKVNDKFKEVIGIKEKNHKYESILVLVLYIYIYIRVYIIEYIIMFYCREIWDKELNFLNRFCDYY